jgi:hypothetical protein
MVEPHPVFAYLPIEVFLDKRLTLEQVRVLGALFSFRSKNSDTVWPSRQAIANRCGMHLSNISTATSALVRLGWLTKDGKGGHSKATRYTITVPDTVAQSATVADAATVAQQAIRTVAHSATRLPVAHSATRKEVNQEHTNGTYQAREQARSSPVVSKSKKAETTLAKFLETCKVGSEKPIPDDDPVFDYADDVGISGEMVEVAWAEFKSYWLTGEGKQKRKKDWRLTFLNAIKQNRSRLWYIKQGESACWTTVGEQARRAAA